MEAPPERNLEPAMIGALSLAIVCAAFLLLGWQVSWTWPFFSDDSFISLRYAERLLDGKGLTWNDGEFVEGYSNLLWVLSTAGLGWLGFDLVAAARFLGVVCVAGTVAVMMISFPPRTVRDIAGSACGPLLLVAAAPLAVWTCGGLEGTMTLLWATWGLLWCVRLLSRDEPMSRLACVGPGLPFALLCLTRPDGAVWALGAALSLGGTFTARAGTRVALTRVLLFLLLPALAVFGQLAFRLVYYGDWVPNTYYVKADLSYQGIVAGWSYLAEGTGVLRGAFVAALPSVFLLFSSWLRATVLVLWTPVLMWGVYLLVIGGDHFLGWRHFFMPLGALAVLAMLGLQFLGGAGRLPALLAGLLAIGVPVLLLADTRADPKTSKACDEHWEWEGRAIGGMLSAAFGEQQPLLAVDGAGAVPFYSRLPCLDMLGLNDRTIATSPPGQEAPVGTFVPGHMRGNGDYVMDRQPDLIQMGRPPGSPAPQYTSALQFESDPRFLQGYRGVIVELPGVVLPRDQTIVVRATLWFRVEGKVGIQRAEDGFVVPGHLVGSYRQPYGFHVQRPPPEDDPIRPKWFADVAELGKWHRETRALCVADRDGHLVLELRDRAPAALSGWELPAGTWLVEVEPAAAVEVVLRGPEGAEVARDLEGDGWVWPGGAVVLECQVAGEAPLPQRIGAVRLRPKG